MIRSIVLLLPILLVCPCVSHGQIRVGPGAPVPFVELPFAASKIAISTDGKWALAWNAEDSQLRRTSLAVIDVSNRRLVSHAIVGEPILDAVIGENVYTVSKSRFCTLSRERLAVIHSALPPDKVMRQALLSSHELQLIGNRHLSYSPTIRFEIPSLQFIELDKQPNKSVEGQTGFGWVLDGVLWDRELTKPILLVWPTKFRQSDLLLQGSWSHSTPPLIDSWYPFVRNKTRWDMYASLALTTSVEFPLRLAVRRTNDGLDLVIVPLDSMDIIAALNLESRFRGVKVDPRPDVAVGGLNYVASIEKKVYVGSLDPYVRSLPQPFHVVPRQNAFLLSATSATNVHYDAEGATEFRISSQAFEATSTDGDFSLSISEEAIDQQIEEAIKTPALREQAFKARDNQALTRKYAEQSNKSCAELFGVETKGIPIPIQVRVIASNAEGTTSSLVHDFLIEVPVAKFERALDQAFPKWKHRSVAATDARAASRTSMGSGGDPDVTQLPGKDDATSQFIRQVQLRAKGSIPQSEIARLAGEAKIKGDQRQSQRFASWLEEVRWLSLTDLQGNRLQARVLQIFAGQITLSTLDGIEFTVDESQLDDASRALLAQATNPTIPQDNDYWRKFALLKNTEAVRGFYKKHRGFPNWAIADAQGQPALSWRVLLLPELGYQELFDLFQLNEPWDSEHNALLLPFMPSVFALDPNLDSGLTSLQTVLESNSPLSPGAAYRETGLEKQVAVPIFVEAHAAHAVAWSKPAELRRADFANPKETLRARSGGYTIITLDGTARRLSLHTSPQQWNELFDF